MSDQQPNQKVYFNIISGDSTQGDGSYGVGIINLDNVTPIIIDPEENQAFIDMEALHGSSQVEKKVRFKPEKEHAGFNPKRYWIVWVTLQVDNKGPYYSGAAACEILVSREERRIKPGYKSMPEQVNNLDKAIRNKVALSHMDEQSRKLFKEFLIEYDAGFWKRSNEDLKQQLN
ncbi:YwhD family protein [Peribacillus sp. NPDC096540]|uniref:YwhD family protein n=1 Tax=Peribacillus sp. NPDC096540 TaxID=3390612 RepID=UPI003D03FEFF